MRKEQSVYLREPTYTYPWTRLTIYNVAPLVNEFQPWMVQTFGASSRLRLDGRSLVPTRQDARWASYSPQKYYRGLYRHVVLFNPLDACVVALRFNVKTVNSRKYDYLFWKPRAWGQSA